MTSHRLTAGTALIAGLSAASLAVEQGANVSYIWGTDGNGSADLARVDYVDSIGKLETLAVSWKSTTTAPSPSGTVKARVKLKVAIRKANGPSVVDLPTMQAVSPPFPDPCDSDNQAGGINETWWSEDWVSTRAYPGRSCAEDIAGFLADRGAFNAAAGRSNDERTLMFGLSLVGYYWNSADEGDASKYKFYSFDADDHSLLCNLGFAGTDENGWELIADTSGVGPFLGPRDDVLRVSLEKETATDGVVKVKTQYYNVRTCELIQQRTATSPAF